MQPLVSVIFPVYNSELYLKDSIESILNQSYQNFEFILINDGSTDNSEKIILSYNDKRIVFINNKSNLGLIHGLNEGIKVSKGDYIIRMDADDISLPKRIEKQINYLEENKNVGVCGCDYIIFGDKSEQEYKAFKEHDKILTWMLFNSSIIHPSLAIRTSVLKSLPVYYDTNYKHAEDYELWSRLIFKCNFSSVTETLFKYRSHSTQTSVQHRTLQIKNADNVRQSVLKRSGFSFTSDELRVHCLLGSSQIITSLNDLNILNEWFNKMESQNLHLKIISYEILNAVLAKQWYDACGITNLGLKAFFIYLKSERKKKYQGSILKLLLKCLIRKF